MQTTKVFMIGSMFALSFGGFFSACTFNHANDPVQMEGQKTVSSPADSDASKAAPAKLSSAKPNDKVAGKGSDKAPTKPALAPKLAAAKAPSKTQLVASTGDAKAAASSTAPGSAPADEKLIRYVSADLLNVHSSPRMDAPVTAKIKRGSMFTVSMINGEWAKVGDGQYVLSRYLTSKLSNGYKVVMGR